SCVVCFGITLGLALHAQKQYTATAQLLIKPSNLPALIAPTQTQSQDSTSLSHLQSDDVSLATSGTVAALAKQRLRTSESAGDLVNQVTASADSTNDLIDIAVSDTDPNQAAAKANAFASALVDYLTASAQQQLISGQSKLQSELAQLPADAPSRSAIRQALEQVIALQAVTNGGAQVVEQAGVARGAPSPHRQRGAGGGAGRGHPDRFAARVHARSVRSPHQVGRGARAAVRTSRDDLGADTSQTQRRA